MTDCMNCMACLLNDNNSFTIKILFHYQADLAVTSENIRQERQSVENDHDTKSNLTLTHCVTKLEYLSLE